MKDLRPKGHTFDMESDSTMDENTGTMYNTIKDASDWPHIYSAAWQRPQNIQRKSLRTIFSVKKNKESWKWRYGPHLNIIESVWDYMKREKHLGLHKSTEELGLVLQDVWVNLPAEFLQKLCASVPRIIDCFEGKGLSHQILIWCRFFFCSLTLHFVNW